MDYARLRPLRTAEILDVSFDLYKEKFSDLLLVAGLFLLVLTTGCIFFFSSSSYSPIVDAAEKGSLSQMADQLANQLSSWFWLLSFGLMLLAPIAWAIPLSIAISHRLEAPRSILQACVVGLKRLPALLVLIILLAIVNSVAALACGIGLLFTLPLSLVSTASLLHESGNPFKAFGKSFRRLNKDSGQVLGSFFCAACLCIVGFFAIYYPVNLLVESFWKLATGVQSVTQYTRSGITDSISAGAAALLVSPYLVCFAAVAYVDLKVRVEAFDIDLLADELGYAALNKFSNVLPPAVPIKYSTGSQKRRGKNAKQK